MSEIKKWIKARRKSITAILGGVTGWAVTTFPHYRWLGLVAAVLTALGVYRVSNEPTDEPAEGP